MGGALTTGWVLLACTAKTPVDTGVPVDTSADRDTSSDDTGGGTPETGDTGLGVLPSGTWLGGFMLWDKRGGYIEYLSTDVILTVDPEADPQIVGHGTGTWYPDVGTREVSFTGSYTKERGVSSYFARACITFTGAAEGDELSSYGTTFEASIGLFPEDDMFNGIFGACEDAGVCRDEPLPYDCGLGADPKGGP